MEAPPQGSSQVPPIVTTPPRCPGLKGELLSQSSSGTQLSNASGLSLGEAIRRRSLMDQDAELWFRPCAETDASNLTGWRPSQTPGGHNATEFLTLEEGSVTPSVNPRRPPASGMTHSPILGVEDSRLSPNLPLLATNATAQGQTFYNETVFQQTGLDFAPLRATPDVSAAAAERPLAGLPIGEAVQLAAREVGPEPSRDASLSQHPLPFSFMAPDNTNLASCLSQHPLTFSEHLPAGQQDWPMLHAERNPASPGLKQENSGMLCPATWPHQPLATCPLPKESWGAAPSQDMFLLDNSLSVPLLLELLEHEMGLPKHDAFLSSENSSCKSGSGKEPAENLTNRLTVDVDLSESAPQLMLEPRSPAKGQTTSRPKTPHLLWEATGKPWRRASDPEALSANLSPALASFRAHELGLVDVPATGKTSSVPGRQGGQEKGPSRAEDERRKFGPAPVDSKAPASAPFQPNPVAATLDQRTEPLKAVPTSVHKTELTLSGGSVEREPRNTGISPFDEGSFLIHLAQPIHHSTPGFWTSRNLNRKGSGVPLPARSGLQTPLACLHEETTKASHADARRSSADEPGVAAAGNPCFFPTQESFPSQGARGSASENGAGSAVLRPLKSRIQSMPSLNFMEKVGAWHLSSSAEELPEGSAVPGSGGVSPRRKAYDTVADSLNCLLQKQQSLANLTSASFYGPSSLTYLHAAENQPLRALPFTRSQSETSVNTLSQEISRMEIGNGNGPKDSLKRAEVNGGASPASRIQPAVASQEESLSRRYKAVPVFTVSSDEEIASTGRRPDPLIRSRRVAELLERESASINGSKEALGGAEENAGGRVMMDYFRDLSPDLLNQGTDSGTDSCTDLRLSSRQSSRSSPALGKLPSGLEEGRETPVHRELNIDERIPVYLHNLGIDQSPSSILTPFMPRGPIREIEFSPTELRTLKASADVFFLHLSEDSQSGKDTTRFTLNSSLLGGSSGAGSAVVADTSQPTQPSPQASRDLLQPSSFPWKSVAVTPPLAISIPSSPSFAVSADKTQFIPGAPSNLAKERPTKIAASPGDNFDPSQLGAGRVKSGSWSQDRDEKPAREEIGSSGAIPGGERGESFPGSKFPKERQELPAEVDARLSSGKFRSLLSLSSSGSLKHIDSVDFSASRGSIGRNAPGIRRGWSWDGSVAKEGIPGSLRWEGLPKEPLVTPEPRPESQKANEDGGTTKPLTRSDPEGCPRTAVNVAVPTSRLVDVHANCSPNLNEVRVVSEAGTLDDVSELLGSFPRVEEKPKETQPKQTGSSHVSANSSSVDSLGARVKELLRYERPAIRRAEEHHGSGPKEPSSVSAPGSAFSRAEVGARESDNGSSLDSLAVRVKTLLEEEQPVLHAAQILQSVKEEEEKARAWVKMKLATQPQYFIPELTEEDRRMIEQMKREQLSCSGEAERLEKQHWRSSFQNFPSPGPAAAVEPGYLPTPRDRDLQMVLQKYGVRLAEFSEPVTDGALAADPEAKKAFRGTQAVASSQPQPVGNALESKADSHVPSDARLKGAPLKEDRHGVAPSDMSEGIGSVEAAIQITSITFASRRRSPPPASRAPRAALAEADARDPVSLEARPTIPERPKSGDSRLPGDDAGSSARLASAGIPEKNEGSPSAKICPPSGPRGVTTGGPHRDVLLVPAERSPSRGLKPRDLVTEKPSVDPVLAEQSRCANTLDRIYAGPEKSMTLPPPKTGYMRSQNPSVDEPRSAAKPLFAVGEGSAFLREGASASDSPSHKPEDTSTPDSYLHKARSRDNGSTGLLHVASLDPISTAVPLSPTSPTRKALSGVHLTLSPKRVEVDLSGPADVSPEVEVVQPTASDGPHLSLGDASRSNSTESKQKTQETSSFPREASSRDVPTGANPVLQETLADRGQVAGPSRAEAGARGSSEPSAGGNSKATASSQTEWTSSDAITQITTESPEKTTYSAEIFVTTENEPVPYPKSHKSPTDTMLGTSKISVLSGQTGDLPLVLPYKPPGCSDVYYVPCGKETLRLSRIRSETTMESSHSGSNDAIPPDFPPQALGSRKDHPSDSAMVKHQEGIYSRKADPRAAWTKAARSSDPGENYNGRSESLKTPHSVFGSAHLKPLLQDELDRPARSKALGQVDAASRGPAPSPQEFLQRKGILEISPSAPPRLAQREENFLPLTGEVDDSFLQGLTFEHASKRELPDAPKNSLGRASQLLSGNRPIKEKLWVADRLGVPKAHPTNSLDDLWAKYLGRQTQLPLKPRDRSRRTELSLVERLDRLARLLQNPLRHSLALASEDRRDSQKEPRRRAPRLGGPPGHKMAAKKVVSQPSLEMAGEEEEAPVSPVGAWLPKSRHPKTGHAKEQNWGRSRMPETPSETSSDLRPSKEASLTTDAASESEGNRVEAENATQTETSESVSTINTARLIRAFGEERVQVSPKLSQLYSTIDLQKTRSESWSKRSKKAKGDGYPKMVHLEQTRKEGQASPASSSSESVSSLSSSRGPSPALGSKRMLNKAVQAGDFEIVNSATKNRTRDVGLTFPTPTPSQATFHAPARSRMEQQRSAQHDGLSAGDEDHHKWQPGSFLEGRRPRRSRSQWTQGVSWFVPAADLKADPREEGGGAFPPTGPAPAWSEPPARGKPWREPLREQNWLERPGAFQVRLAARARDAENQPPSPLREMTLQESLAAHRPDFLSSSGERLKRLKLLVEERKLQSVFQGEREQLFNPPEAVACLNTSLANRGYRTIRSRAISKNEMVERSKRIYEQLPEVRKRREEEKRKSEYSTNRLKAQLYKTKITNRVLGRKVPWE